MVDDGPALPPDEQRKAQRTDSAHEHDEDDHYLPRTAESGRRAEGQTDRSERAHGFEDQRDETLILENEQRSRSAHDHQDRDNRVSKLMVRCRRTTR